MWTNGLLMLALGVLTLFNVLLLLAPPAMVSDLLTLMSLPLDARTILLFAAAMNVIASLIFERWGAEWIAVAIGKLLRWRGRRRVREGKTYKAVEGGML